MTLFSLFSRIRSFSALRLRPSTRERLIRDGLPQARQWPFRLSEITSQLAHKTANRRGIRFKGNGYSRVFSIPHLRGQDDFCNPRAIRKRATSWQLNPVLRWQWGG